MRITMLFRCVVLFSLLLGGLTGYAQCPSRGDGNNSYCLWGSGCYGSMPMFCTQEYCTHPLNCHDNLWINNECTLMGCYNPFQANCKTCLY